MVIYIKIKKKYKVCKLLKYIFIIFSIYSIFAKGLLSSDFIQLITALVTG